MSHPLHPSTLALERFTLGESLEAERAEISAHLRGCASCEGRLSSMSAQAASYSVSSHSSVARERVVRADWAWRRNAVLATVVPAAALITLITAAPWKERPIAPPPVAVNSASTTPRHGRTPIDLRPDATLARLRNISVRGRVLEVGQGTFEGAVDDGAVKPFILEHTDVVAELNGFVSSVTVTQRYKNPFALPAEAIYVFPLPDDAAVDEMTLTAGARTIRAVIQKREQARRMYEEAKSQGRRAALLDQERPNIFTQSVANLLPGETVRITLRYVAPLKFDDGAYTFNFPMVVGPRYIPGAPLPGNPQGTGTSPDMTRVLDASRVTPPAERTGRDISIEVKLEAGVLLMTDGYIGNEREVFGETERILGNARLFGFGVGDSVNHYLLSRLSELGRGFYQYIRTDENPAQAVERFTRRISKPLFTDVSLQWTGVQVDHLIPSRVPDLFDAQPLIVLGRYREPGSGMVKLSGRVNGVPVELTAPVAFPNEPTAAGLTSMWARARIEEIVRLQHFGEFNEAVKEITTLGLEYHLVTAYTSFVAVDGSPVTSSMPGTVIEPTGVSEPQGARVPSAARIRPALVREQTSTYVPAEVPALLSSAGEDEFEGAFGSSDKAVESSSTSRGRREVYIPPPPGRGPEEVEERTHSAVVEHLIQQKLAVAACAEEGARLSSGKHGKFLLRLVIGPDGRVTSIRIEGPDESGSVGACLVRTIKAMSFGKSKGSFEMLLPFKY